MEEDIPSPQELPLENTALLNCQADGRAQPRPGEQPLFTALCILEKALGDRAWPLFVSCLSLHLPRADHLMGSDCLLLSGASEIVQLLCEGESQPSTTGQAGNEHLERHAGDSKPGKESGLWMMRRGA